MLFIKSPVSSKLNNFAARNPSSQSAFEVPHGNLLWLRRQPRLIIPRPSSYVGRIAVRTWKATLHWPDILCHLQFPLPPKFPGTERRYAWLSYELLFNLEEFCSKPDLLASYSVLFLTYPCCNHLEWKMWRDGVRKNTQQSTKQYCRRSL
jgi:hypothetical protein